MTQQLKGKVAIVTGANLASVPPSRCTSRPKAPGRHGGARTVQGGYQPVARLLNAVADRIRALGGECLASAPNLAKEEQRGNIVPRTVARFGGVGILVNNAAWCRYQACHDHALKDVRQTLEVNMVAPLIRAGSACQHEGARRRWIVNLSSAICQSSPPVPYDFEWSATPDSI